MAVNPYLIWAQYGLNNTAAVLNVSLVDGSAAVLPHPFLSLARASSRGANSSGPLRELGFLWTLAGVAPAPPPDGSAPTAFNTAVFASIGGVSVVTNFSVQVVVGNLQCASKCFFFSFYKPLT